MAAATGPGPRAARVATVLQVALIVAACGTVTLGVSARGGRRPADLASLLGSAVACVAYALLGALIVRRTGNLIGWLMLGESAAIAFSGLASSYAVLGVTTFPGSLPAPRQAGTLAEVGFTGVAFSLAFMVFLF